MAIDFQFIIHLIWFIRTINFSIKNPIIRYARVFAIEADFIANSFYTFKLIFITFAYFILCWVFILFDQVMFNLSFMLLKNTAKEILYTDSNARLITYFGNFVFRDFVFRNFILVTSLLETSILVTSFLVTSFLVTSFLVTLFGNFVFGFLSVRLRDFLYNVFLLRGKIGKTKWKINKLLRNILVTSLPKPTKNEVTEMGWNAYQTQNLDWIGTKAGCTKGQLI